MTQQLGSVKFLSQLGQAGFCVPQQGCQVGIFHANLQEFGIFWHFLVHDKNMKQYMQENRRELVSLC